MYLNEGALSKILGIGGALAGAGIAGHEFLDIANQGEHINAVVNPELANQNTLSSIAAATKIPFYALGGGIAGITAGAGLKSILNSNSTKTARSVPYNRRSYVSGS
jgi:hypothetical protein